MTNIWYTKKNLLLFTQPDMGHRSTSYSGMVTNAWSQVHTQNFSPGEGKGDGETVHNLHLILKIMS